LDSDHRTGMIHGSCYKERIKKGANTSSNFLKELNLLIARWVDLNVALKRRLGVLLNPYKAVLYYFLWVTCDTH